MSNPLAIFRKNRNYWMAGLVLLAILAFVVAPAIQTISDSYRGGGAANESAVVVRWDGGKITRGDLDHNVTQHGRLIRFLSALARKVLDSGGMPDVPGAGFSFDAQGNQLFNLGVNMSSSEQAICQTRILAAHAQRIGVELNDQSADDFLDLFCDGKISQEVFEELRLQSTDGQLSDFEIRELLKTEIAARIAGQIAETGLVSQTPGQVWRDFLKLNQTAKVAAFPIFVDDYMKDVKTEPTESQIQAIYDSGSTRAPNPSSAEPGFIRRYHANFEYLQSNFQDWVDREKQSLTEEEIRKEYDRRAELKLLEVPVTLESPESAASTEPADASTTPTDDPVPPAEVPPAEASAVPAVDTPAAGEVSEPAAALPPQPAADDQSSMREAVATRLVAFTQETQSPPPVVQPPQLGEETAATPAAANPVDRAPVVSPEPTSPEPTSPEPTSPEPTSPEQAATEQPPVAADPAVVPADPADAGASETPSMRTKTFEEARDEIAEELARTRMIPKLDEVLTNVLVNEMTPYYGAYRQFRAFRESGVESGEGSELPKRPDLKKYAEEHNLDYGQTELVDGVQIAKTPFGLSQIPNNDSGITGMVANVAMGPQIEMFKPFESGHLDQAASIQTGKTVFLQFIFWKVAERAAYIPELKEVRDEVIDAWKRIQARELADAAAKQLAQKLKGGDDAWQAALSTSEQALVVETEPFTWMSRLGQQADITPVPRLDTVGAEFMEQVFATPVGQAAVAPNANKSVMYVFRVTEMSPSDDELRERFNADPLKSGPINISRFESQKMLASWYENLEKELGVEWQVPTN